MSGGELVVGFDGRDLLRKRTGIVNYALHLATALRDRPGGRLLVYGDGYTDPAIAPPADVPVRRLWAPPVLWKHAALPLALVRDRATLFHSPTGTLPLWSPCPQVVTIHDLFAFEHPEWFPGSMGARLRSAQRMAVRRASRIIAVSEATRRSLERFLRVPAHRVDVVANGVDHTRFSPLTDHRPAASTLEYLGVREPFILCVGSLMPWRNAPRLLAAVAELRRTRGLSHHLLFVGRDIWGTDPTRAIAAESGWTDWAHFAGYVADEHLPALYAAADVFAYPSLTEGFGIPPVEAMACGKPTVASSAPAFHEVLGDAALLPDPMDVDALADALWAAATDEPTRRRLSEEGPRRAARYDWSRSAQATWTIYRKEPS